MNYKKIYEDLINKAKNREKIEGYYEKHHIIPRCIGGNDNEENLVKLTAKEHFIAHKLLCKIYSYSGIRYAYSMMVMTSINFLKSKNDNISIKRNYRISSNDYEECIHFLKKNMSKKFKNKKYINNGEIQITVYRDEINKYLDSGWKLGKLPFSEEVLKRIREFAKNRKISKETHIKKSNSVSGEKNPSYNTKMMNKNGINKRIKIELIDEYLNNGWKLGMIIKDKIDRKKRLNLDNSIKCTAKNKKYVHMETYPYLIRYSNLEDFDYYINILKWKPGAGKFRNECKKNNYLLKKIKMFKQNPFEVKKIPIELKELYLSRGWEIGNGNYYKKINQQ